MHKTQQRSTSKRTRIGLGAVACVLVAAIALVGALSIHPLAPAVDTPTNTERAASKTASQTETPSSSQTGGQQATAQQAGGGDTSFGKMVAALPDVIELDQSAEVEPVQAEHEADTLLMTVSENVTAGEVNDLLKRVDFVATKDVSDQDLSTGFVKLALMPGTDVARAAQTLKETGVVEGAQPNYAYHLLDANLTGMKIQSTSVNDPKASSQWALAKVRAYEAWDVVKVNKSVTVAVIDDGCVADHEDLADNIVATYNAVTKTTDVSHVSTNYHGTHVAGIVSGVSNNALGISGVTYNAGILPIQVFEKYNNSETAYTSSLVTAYNFIMANADTYKIRVVNMSLGGAQSSLDDTDELTLRRIEQAYSKGIVTVCAACNSSSSNTVPYKCFPTDFCDSIVGVINLKQDSSASDGSGLSVSTSSNYNMPGQTTKDISAPGTSIYSTYGPDSSQYRSSSGTSMASPLVAGILALEFAADPTLTAAGAVQALYDGAVDLGDEGWDEKTGYGMASAYGAIQAIPARLSGSATVEVGASTRLTPSKYNASSWTWKSSNESVASVSASGVVTGNSAGSATITATYGDVSATKTVTVYSARLSGASLLKAGSSYAFTLESAGLSGSWSLTSSNTNVAMVTVHGSTIRVTGVGAGDATITATNSTYGITATAAVSVCNPSLTNSAGASTVGVLVDGEDVLTLTGGPADAAWIWESSDEEVCTVQALADTTQATIRGVSVGKATIIATLASDTSFQVSTTVNVATEAITDEATEVSLSAESYTYSADTLFTPTVTVVHEGNTLTLNKHYKVEYFNNDKAGTATVTVAGCGGYVGTITRTFTIEPASISTAVIGDIADQTYTGKAINPEPAIGVNCSAIFFMFVKTWVEPLSKDTDYSLAYANNKNAGTATITITGKGNYTGTTSTTFTIAPAPISKATVAPIAKRTYTGVAAKPAPSLTYGGTTLRNGTDYSVAYAKNVNAGTATISITGKGNFTGATSASFAIASAPLSKASVSAIAKRAYTGRAIQPLPTVRMGSKKLARNTDYWLKYANNTKAGTASVTVTGIGNYSGTKTVRFKIVAPSVAYRTKAFGSSWASYVKNGKISGDTTPNMGLRSLAAKLAVKPYAGSLKYRVRTQKKWLYWKMNGTAASISGSSNRMEALQMKLTGKMSSHYDVYYRVYVQNLGWSGWAKNGASVGSSGYESCLYALQVKVVPKGSAAPGKTANAFRKQ